MTAARHILGPTKPRRVGRVPKQAQPDRERFAYALALKAVTDDFARAVRESLLPQLPALVAHAGSVHDADEPSGYTERVARELERIASEWLQRFPSERLRSLALHFGRRTSEHSKSELTRQLSAAMGREVNIDVLSFGSNVEERLQEWASANALLIKDVGARARAEVTQTAIQALKSGTRAGDVEQEIQERLEVSESRARLIARDQIGKINGELNAARQQAVGIPGFYWRTVGDERVRDEHEVLDGRYFDWDEPPDEGIPGEPINCRCIAEPAIREFLDAL